MLRKMFQKLTRKTAQDNSVQEWHGFETTISMGHGYAELARDEAGWNAIWHNLGRKPPCSLPANTVALAIYGDFEEQAGTGLKVMSVATEKHGDCVVQNVRYEPHSKTNMPAGKRMLWGVKLLDKPCHAVVANGFLANPALFETTPVKKQAHRKPGI